MQAPLLDSNAVHATAVLRLWAARSGVAALPSCVVGVCVFAAALLQACSQGVS